jgi:hypothetical protein
MAVPDPGRMDRALARARDGLGLAAGDSLTLSEASVFMKYLLLEELGKDGIAGRRRAGEPLADIRRALEIALDRLPERQLPDIGAGPAWRRLRLDREYRSRLLDMTVEAVLGERLAPETCLKSAPHDEAIWSGRRHAVMFGSAPGFSHEFYPLAVDAYVSAAGQPGEPGVLPLGVHLDWLDAGGAIRRAIALDPERERLVEAPVEVPFHPDSVQFLCLGSREQTLHHDLAARFACPQVNPLAPSALADDKAATLAGWSALALETPRSRRFAPGDAAAAERFAADLPDIVIKPNAATEGLGVVYPRRRDPGFAFKVFAALESCWRLGDALIQERRDGVLFLDPRSGSLHSVALRLNLVREDQRYRPTSGFAQIGAHPDQPASRGRNGRILPLDVVLSHLVERRGPRRPVAGPDESLWADIETRAARAAGLFGNLLLVGLDVVLDLSADGRLVPVFLEANPRPAGLCHSRLFSGSPSRHDQVGVGPTLWRGLAALCQ